MSNKWNAVVGCAVLFSMASVSHSAATEAPPSTGQSLTSLRQEFPVIRPFVLNVGNTNVATISIRPVRIVPQSSPVSLASEDMLVRDAAAGVFHTGFAIDGSGYEFCNGLITWTNLVYGQNTTWPIVAELVEIDSVAQANDVSLDMLTFSSHSPTDGGVLDDTLGFVGLNYTSEAFVVNTDGTLVKSGSDSVKGQKVFVIVYMKLFNGGDTQAGLDSVMNWVNQHNSGPLGYIDDFTAQIVGDVGSLVHAIVSINGPQQIAIPTLAISRTTNNTVMVWVVNPAGDSAVYNILSSPIATKTGPWTFQGSVIGSAPLEVPVDSAHRFFQARIQ